MVKFYDVVGYGDNVEQNPGVWGDNVTERSYYGDVIRPSRRSVETQESVNNDLSVGNSISIVADAYANEHFHAIRYVRWSGQFWLVSNIDVEPPRLILRLGGVYNGPTAD